MFPSLVLLAFVTSNLPAAQGGPILGQWMPSNLPAAAIARKVDQKLLTIGPASMKFHFTFSRKGLGSGTVDGNATILSPKVFRVLTPQVDLTRGNALEANVWITDGKRFSRAPFSSLPKPGPLSTRPKPTRKPLNDWFNNFSEIVFGSIGLPANTFSNLVSQAKAAKYAVVAQQRTLTFQGHQILSYRILLTKGPIRYETVVDGHGWVPVTVTNTIGDNSSRWSAVRWNMRPNQPIDRSLFKFKK